MPLAKTMWQSVLTSVKTSTLEKRPMPVPQDDEVLIKVKICGVCASELHPWVHANAETELGHEVVGEIIQLGSSVKKLELGIRVTGLIYKGFAEYTVAKACNVIPVPDGLADEAALGEPLSCVVSGIRRTNIDLADKVAVIGLGYMGLLTLQLAALKGPSELIAIDPRLESRQNALKYGADRALDPSEVDANLVLESWQDIPKGTGVNVAIEAAGNTPALSLAGRMAKAHGVLSIVGYHQADSTLVDMQMWNWKALSVLNAHERRDTYQMDCMQRGLTLIAARKLHTLSLVSHTFSLENVDDAYHGILDKPTSFIKGIIRVSD